jgi:8-oxo-dGTP diphosphatase
MPAAEQGVDTTRYSVIPRVLVFITGGNDVLLLKGSANKRIWPNQYNGIGGHIERGEDVLHAARRELLEEAGMSPTNLWLCGVVTVDTGQNPGIAIFVFRGDSANKDVLDSHEGRPEWIPVDRIHDIPLVKDLHVLLPRVLSSLKGDAPFFAQYAYNVQDELEIEIRSSGGNSWPI